MKKHFLLIASVLSITLLFTSCLSTDDLCEKVITVSAVGEVNLTPDIVTFNIEASEVRDTTSKALNATNEKISKVINILELHNVAKNDIKTNSINLYPQYEWKDGERHLVGQSASQSLQIKLRDINKLGSIIDEVGKISNINLYSINYDKDDKKAAYNEARELAVKYALEKANILANAAGMEIKEAISISEGSPAYVSYNRVNSSKMMMAESAAGYSTETPSGELTISTTVNIIFTME